MGALVKGGAALETLSATRVVAFDKTGTLTRNEPGVVNAASPGSSARMAPAWMAIA